MLLRVAVVAIPQQGVRARQGLLRVGADLPPPLMQQRGLSEETRVCHDSGSFLGVGNTECLHANLGTAVFLLGVIIVVSISFEKGIAWIRRRISCPQLRKIVNRLFEEVMVMGFISMVIFTLNTSGAMQRLNFDANALSSTEQLHFYEFFHYIVFLTMIYFIAIVLLLLFFGTVVPKLIWEIKNQDNESDEDEELRDEDDEEDDLCVRAGAAGHSTLNSSRASGPYRSNLTLRRATSGMDLVMGSRAYSLLLQRYQREGWCFRFNLRKQWNLWKSFEILAYNICQHRSGYIYKNPSEMERLFGVPQPPPSQYTQYGEQNRKKYSAMTYDKYHVLCMRNLLVHISSLHYSAFFILVVICVLPSVYPDKAHWIFIGVGCVLLLVNLVIFFKVLQILRGIVDDRLRVITARDIQNRLTNLSAGSQRSWRKPLGSKAPRVIVSTTDSPPVRQRMSFKSTALAVRAVIRMQMSALCHRQLHHHDDRFWFHSPMFLLRLFQFATIGQAFYLVWFSLVEAQSLMQEDTGSYLISIMVLLPFIALCVITPMTMPSLVLVMSLTGIFVDLNSKDHGCREGRNEVQAHAKTHIRLMRRSYLKSNYHSSALEDPYQSPQIQSPCDGDTVTSPTNVFLRIYDSPTAAATHRRQTEEIISPMASPSQRTSSLDRITGALLLRRSQGSYGSAHNSWSQCRDASSSARPSFNLAAFQASGDLSAPAVKAVVYGEPPDQNSSVENTTNLSHALIGTSGSSTINNPPVPVPPPRTPVSAAATAEPSMMLPSPVSASFKSYCSKYGGYPDL